MNNKITNSILIGIIVLFCIAIGFVAFKIITNEPAVDELVVIEKEKEEIIKDPIGSVVKVPVDPVIKDSNEKLIPAFKPDETIPYELCRRFINRDQLKKITGYDKDAFVFKFDRWRDATANILKKGCIIKIKEKEIMRIILPQEGEVFSFDESYEANKKDIEKMIAWDFVQEGAKIQKIQNLGKKAFLGSAIMTVNTIKLYLITFLETDTNQVIEIIGTGLDYEIILSLAKQVEVNVR